MSNLGLNSSRLSPVQLNNVRYPTISRGSNQTTLQQSVKSWHLGMWNMGSKWMRMVLNGKNSGLLNIRCQFISAQQAKMFWNLSDLKKKKVQMCPIRCQSYPFWAKIWYSCWHHSPRCSQFPVVIYAAFSHRDKPFTYLCSKEFGDFIHGFLSTCFTWRKPPLIARLNNITYHACTALFVLLCGMFFFLLTFGTILILYSVPMSLPSQWGRCFDFYCILHVYSEVPYRHASMLIYFGQKWRLVLFLFWKYRNHNFASNKRQFVYKFVVQWDFFQF